MPSSVAVFNASCKTFHHSSDINLTLPEGTLPIPILPIKALFIPAFFIACKSLTTPSCEILSDTQYQYVANCCLSGIFLNPSSSAVKDIPPVDCSFELQPTKRITIKNKVEQRFFINKIDLSLSEKISI